MKNFFLFSLLFASSVSSKLFSKDISVLLDGKGAAENCVYFIFNGFLACIFFLFSSKFHTVFNTEIAIYGVLYTVCVIISLITGLVVYRHLSVTVVCVASSAGNLIFSSVLGYLFWHEDITVIGIIRNILMAIAVFLLYPIKKEDKQQFQIKSLLWMIALILVSAAVTVISKLFATCSSGKYSSSLFFWVNIFLIVFSFVWLFILFCLDSDKTKQGIKAVPKKALGAILGNCVSSNVGSLLSVALLATVSVSLYSPLNTSFAVLAGVVVSLIKKEKLSFNIYLATLISIIALVLPY